MWWALQIVGAGLILLAIVDVFLTVLYARSGTGLISPRIHQFVWRTAVRCVGRQPKDVRKHLSFGGPMMMVLSVGTWGVMLLLGSALVVWPELGNTIHATDGSTSTNFAEALYFSGYSLATLGLGDLVPSSGASRLFTVLLAFVGFSLFTLTITYFMSVYSALVRRT